MLYIFSFLFANSIKNLFLLDPSVLAPKDSALPLLSIWKLVHRFSGLATLEVIMSHYRVKWRWIRWSKAPMENEHNTGIEDLAWHNFQFEADLTKHQWTALEDLPRKLILSITSHLASNTRNLKLQTRPSLLKFIPFNLRDHCTRS